MAEVLIVDSASKRGKYIRDVIKTRGYETRLVKTASAASRKMSHRWADVVFMTESAADDGRHGPDVFRVVYPGSNSSRISTKDSKFFLDLITTLQNLVATSSRDFRVSYKPAKKQMPKLVRQVVINASKENVWEVLADFSGVANWAPTILESRSTTEANGGVGAERTCKHVTIGNIEGRIIAWEDGRSLSYDVIKGLAFPIKSLNNTWTVNSAGDNAIVSVTMDFRMGLGPLGVLPALMARLSMRKGMQVSLAGLKQYVETGELVTTTKDLAPTSLAAVD